MIAGSAGSALLPYTNALPILSGAISNLATLDVTGTSSVSVAAVTTTGAQSYTGTTTLNGNLSGAGITFNDGVLVNAATLTVDATSGALQATTIAGSAGTENLDLLGGTVAVSGAISNLATLDVNGATVINLNGGSITTSGSQTFNGAVILGISTTLTGNNVTFNNTVDGALALTVTAAT